MQQQQQMLLRYAAQLSREKNVLMQRTLELTDRWNAAASENMELRARLPDGGASVPAAPPPPPLAAAAIDTATVLGQPVE